MKKAKKELLKFTVKEFLLTFVDFGASCLEICDFRYHHKKLISQYREGRELNKEKFSQIIYRLKKQGIIESYFENKREYLVLSLKGKKKTQDYLLSDLQIPKPEEWDNKWRLVIFDIPDTFKNMRNIFRKKLLELGFVKLQESVFIHPYKCKEIIDFLKTEWQIKPYVLYLVVDRVESEINLIHVFADKEILK